MGCISQILASLANMLSPQIGQWILFAGPIIDFFNGANSIVNKALLTKIVPEDELGKFLPNGRGEGVVAVIALHKFDHRRNNPDPHVAFFLHIYK